MIHLEHTIWLAVTAICALATTAGAVSPTPGEMDRARQWASAKFEGVRAAAPKRQGLCVIANNGPVQLNARGDRPLNLGGVEYKRGLYCHAISYVLVSLPKPAKTFSSVIGIDKAAGAGSVVFSVEVDGKERFKSAVLHCDEPGVPVSVDLNGATDFALRVGDAGDGIACDQADWADARVIFEDGSNMWLGDLPITEHEVSPPNCELPFSFVYGGKPSSEFLPSWKLERTSKQLDKSRKQHTSIYTDPKTGLQVRCVGVQYSDYPVVEWTVYLKNTGKADTPIISEFKGIDTRFERRSQGEFVLHTLKGDDCSPDSYEPLNSVLQSGKTKTITAVRGRPTQVVWPYFNIEFDSHGVIAAIGWPGQWSADFVRDDGIALRFAGGQELTHFKLKPGEEVRSPLIALLFWEGDYLRSQNIWRRWMLAHNMPRLKPILASCSGGYFSPSLKVSTQTEKLWIDKFKKEGIDLDYWWMDAGWYACSSWPETGTWEYDKERFPNGIREVSDYARSKGVKQILWFEPERVTANTWITKEHPEWVLGGKDGGLLNLGDPECLKWLTGHIDAFIKSQGIDLYRQDYNIDPLAYWKGNDAPDRQGITENHHITGYLAYWDELIKRNPGIYIDSCASGGRRNDLETLRRSVPLLRSDYQTFDGNPATAPGNQGHTYGLSFWIPYYGQGCYWSPNQFTYVSRSYLCPATAICADARRSDVDWDQIRKAVSDFSAVGDFMLADYYPLTSYSIDEADWIAWQFNRPETGEGMIQVFRRKNCIYRSGDLLLHALDPAATYSVTDIDTKQSSQFTGRDLMEKGLPLTLNERSSAVILTYRKAI